MSNDGSNTILKLELELLTGPALDPIAVEPGTQATLGRSADSTFCLPDASVSRQHLKISPQNQQWLLTDLGSRHGTFLNGIKLTPQKATPTSQGDLLRIGPFKFRVHAGDKKPIQHTIAEPTITPGTIVESIPDRELHSLAHRRLSLLIEGSAKIYQAQTESELAHAVINLIRAGTGFPRAALLRWQGTVTQVEIMAFEDTQSQTADRFVFSQSLLQASADGSMAKLSRATQQDYGQSIAGLGILSALAAPLLMDNLVIGAIYLDSRAGENPPQPDAATFCYAVSQIASLALSSLKRIELAKRQAQLDEDLKIAQEAQAFLLPPPNATVGPLRYALRTQSGATVGGDLFDLIAIDETRTGICIGDITGHGIGAALIMTAILSHLRVTLAASADPAAAVTETNAYLTKHSSDRMFATLWVAVFDATTHELTYVDAGHGHWLIARADETKPDCPTTRTNLMAGIIADFEFAAEKTKLNPDDRLILYSDGIVEQSNHHNQRFEEESLEKIIANSHSIQNDIDQTFAALQEFTGSHQFDDDTTIASIEIH